MTLHCPECDKELKNSFLYCPHCGSKVRDVDQCSSCGGYLKSSWRFCPYCRWQTGTIPVKVLLNQIRLTEDIYPFFAAHPGLGSIEKIRHLEIAQFDSVGNPTDRYKNRQTSIKVGYALEIIAEHGLTESFESMLSETGRSIRDTYQAWYLENESQVRWRP